MAINSQLYSQGFFVGAAVSGMEFGGGPYVPSTSVFDYMLTKGITMFRLPFTWEELQPTLYGPLSTTILSDINGLVNHCAGQGQKIILDIHNFGTYNGQNIGTTAVPIAAFANVWQQLSLYYKGNPGIGGYDLMNEPVSIPYMTWNAAAQAAITAIRNNNDSTWILVEGIDYSAAPQWLLYNTGLSVTDPCNNFTYTPHCYANANNDGTYQQSYAADGANPDVMVQRWHNPQGWALQRGVPLCWGEGGVPYYDPNWLVVLDRHLSYLQGNGTPGLLWSSGAWSHGYPLSLNNVTSFMNTQLPGSSYRDTAIMAVVSKYTGAGQPRAYYIGGPPQGPNGLPSGPFTVQYYGNLSEPVVITPSAAAGTFSPTSITLSADTFNPMGTFTYTPAATGVITISVSAVGETNGTTLTNPPSISYTSLTTSGTSVYEQAAAPLLFAWAPFQLISTYSASGNCLTIKRLSDNTSETFAFTTGSLNLAAISTFLSGTTGIVTELYDQSGNANNAITYTNRDPPGIILDAQNSLPVLSFAISGGISGNDQGLTLTNQVLGTSPGVSIFFVGKIGQVNPVWIMAGVAQTGGTNFAYGDNGQMANAGMPYFFTLDMTDTTMYHSYGVNTGMGDYVGSAAAYIDGNVVSTGGSVDLINPIGQCHFDIGMFRNYQPDGYTGTMGQIVAFNGCTTASDAARFAVLDSTNWGTP